MDNLMMGLSTAAIGMIVVFLGLIILICAIQILGKFDKKEPEKATVDVAPVMSEVVEEEIIEDDTEVIAAITAALAVLLDTEKTDDTQSQGFVVRRVRKISQSPAWQKMARDEQIYSRM